jgi:TorA maturation chaperone TorD
MSGLPMPMSEKAASEEYEALFIGIGKPDILLYGSHHLAGALNEKPLVALRTDLADLGLARDATIGETEDHVSFLFEVMRYLIAGDDVAVCNLERQRRFFRTHIQPWVVGSLCDAVEQHRRARLYAALAVFTRAFLQVETQGFDMIE